VTPASATPPGTPRRIGIVGGGTAGYFAALAIKRRFPDIDVTVVESKQIPIIGVGEATTTLMPPFLHTQLGLDMTELFRDVGPTFKLGIRFEWGRGDGHFNYPFGDTDPLLAVAFDGSLARQSLLSMVMDAGGAPILRGPEGQIVSLLPEVKFAYHLDNAPFVAFLSKAAARRGILHEEMVIDAPVPMEGAPGIRALRGTDGRELSFDLYVDASGFRSLLLGASLASPFVSYASSLFCDRAIVGAVPHGGVIGPYTTAETMNAGWCWRIPVRGEDHRGYVFASAFMDEDAATAEMRAKNPALGDTRVVAFRSGRHRDFWRHNVVGVGNAYGFVEPLESTALHMVIVEIAYLLAGIETMARPDEARTFPSFANEAVGSHWDYLRWFLAIHYRFNGRLDTAFWRAARADVDTSGLDELVRTFQSEGPGAFAGGADFQVGDPAFGFSGAMLLLLGQQVPSKVQSQGGMSLEEWRERTSRQAGVARWALPHAEALAVLRDQPDLLRRCGASTRSWVRSDAEQVAVLASRQRVHPRSGMPPADALLRGAAGRKA
jgi:tryptophan halogenase